MDGSNEASSSISNRVLYIISPNHFLNEGSTCLISDLFPAITVAFAFSKYQIGILVALELFVNLILQPLTGRHPERYEVRKPASPASGIRESARTHTS